MYRCLKRLFLSMNVIMNLFNTGEPSNQCPTGFELDTEGLFCKGALKRLLIFFLNIIFK